MKFLKSLLLAVAAMSFVSAATAAGDKGTADEAVALVKKATAFVKANGNEKAYAEFNNAKGQFIDRDMYIFVMDMSGKVLAHGVNPKLLDKNLLDLRDADGKNFAREFLEVAKAKGKGWVDYKWPNPVTKAIEPKTTYVEKVGDVVVACGIYK